MLLAHMQVNPLGERPPTFELPTTICNAETFLNQPSFYASPTTSSLFFDCELKPPTTSLPTSILVKLTRILRMPNDIAPCVFPLQIPGDETHTLLHCPHFSLLIQPAIDSLVLNLRRFDLWAWTTYTDTQKVAMLLGAIPLKLDRQHEKAWVLLTFPTCTQLIHSLQSHWLSPYPTLCPPRSLPPFH